jgi:hypothetical protein
VFSRLNALALLLGRLLPEPGGYLLNRVLEGVGLELSAWEADSARVDLAGAR